MNKIINFYPKKPKTKSKELVRVSRPLPGDTAEAPGRVTEIPSVLNVQCKEVAVLCGLLIEAWDIDSMSLDLWFTVSI